MITWLIVLCISLFIALIFFVFASIVNYKKVSKLEYELETKNKMYSEVCKNYDDLCETIKKLQKDFNEVDEENMKKIEELEKKFDEVFVGKMGLKEK